MPSYAPLPPIELDPRNESELLAAAAQRVYEASGAAINDFSSGSPIMALLEGQVFAQAELLAFANSFPESVLVEWIGPFLGAQRRTGAGAVVNLRFEIRPTQQDFVVFPGFEVSSDPNLTNGTSVSFVTADRLRIPPGETTGTVRAVALLKGTFTNVPPNSLVRPVTSLAGVVSVTNLEAGAGGQDPELLAEVKERFFSLIRRRNPVSAEDWQDFFSDALGPGTGVNVLPRRSERDLYRYNSDFVTSVPAVAFFVINPDGSPLTSAQRSSLQNLLRFALPIEFEGTVYPMEVDDADVVVDLLYDPNKPYAQDLQVFTETVRNNLFGIMTPNAVFPVNYDPNVTDIESSLATSFPFTLGTTSQYIDPDIVGLRLYYTPRNLGAASFTVTEPQQFVTGSAFKAGDVVINSTGSVPQYYPVLEDFTPVTGTKSYHANTDDLSFAVIKDLSPGEYSTGDVISVRGDGDASLHVILASFTYAGNRTPAELIESGLVSAGKPFTSWVPGAEITATSPLGIYDPEIVSFERDDLTTEVYEPRTPSSVPLERRVGYPVWVVKRNFTIEADISDLGTAQERNLVGRNRLQFDLLLNGDSYSAGDYVLTPSSEEFLTERISPDSCFIDEQRGVVQLYALVETDFTFFLRDGQSYSDAIDELVRAGIIRLVQVTEYIDCAGRPQFLDRSFKYRARFKLGEYLRYRPEGGFDASQLEECLSLAQSCEEVTPACKRLLEENLPLPRYFQALVDFTPPTQDPDEIVELGYLLEVDPSVFRYDYVVQADQVPPGFSSEQITEVLQERELIASVQDLEFGQTVFIRGPLGEDLGSYFWSFSGWRVETGGIPTFRDLFRFAPKDAATFRNGSSLRQYEATEHVTPIADLESYFDNGVFIRSTRPETVKYYDPQYNYEDVVYDFTDSSQKFYRVIRSFTPPDEVETWAGNQLNSPRAEEVFGNLLKLAIKAEGSGRVFSRLGSQVSANKLGTATVKVTSKANTNASYTYVWESTDFADSPTELSYYPRTDFQFGPIDYKDGTLAL
jgi:hypothetical protein